VEKISCLSVSTQVRQLHKPPDRMKRYHIDDLVIYIPRTHDYPHLKGIGGQVNGVEYAREAMENVAGVWRIGQPAYDLCDLIGEEE